MINDLGVSIEYVHVLESDSSPDRACLPSARAVEARV